MSLHLQELESLDEEQTRVLRGVEAAVRKNLTAFAPCLISQLAGLEEELTERCLAELSKICPDELECETYGICPQCQFRLAYPFPPGPNELLLCGPCETIFPTEQLTRHVLYTPRGPLASATPAPFTTSGALSRPSALAERRGTR
jgi:hypothetical protein